MILHEAVEKSLKSQKSLELIKADLALIFKNPSLEKYSWEKTNDSYQIQKGGNTLYQESNQHVTAAANLMRIPNDVWLLWANQVLIDSKDEIAQFKLNEKLEIFKNAFEKTIKLCFYEKDFKATLKEVPCLNCHKISFLGPYSREALGKKFFFQICKTCGLGIRYPRPDSEQLSKIYSEEEYFGGKNTERGYFDYASEASWRIEKAFKYLERLEEVSEINPKNTNVLDIGSGYGYFQKALKDKGYKNLGIEVAPDAVEFSRKNYLVETFEGDVPTLMKNGKLRRSSFDLITLWDVIEHFYDFSTDLEQIVKLLQKNGYIALRTNNISSIEYQVFGKYFHSIKYEHTFYYTQKVLKEIFKKFNVVESKTWTHTHLFLAFMTKEEITQINLTNRGGDIFFVGQKQ